MGKGTVIIHLKIPGRNLPVAIKMPANSPSMPCSGDHWKHENVIYKIAKVINVNGVKTLFLRAVM